MIPSRNLDIFHAKDGYMSAKKKVNYVYNITLVSKSGERKQIT